MSSLLAERGPIHVNVGATLVLDGDPPALEELLEHVESRLALVPRFRQRVQATPLQLTNPVWVDDPRFDLRWYVRHAALPRPGSPEQLRDLVGRVMSEPLDLERPLWQRYLIEGLEAGRHAYISKTHHALVDGVSAVDVGTIMLDPNPDGTEMPVPEERWDPDAPSPELLFVRAAGDRIRTPLRTARKAALSALTMPRETAGRVMRTAESFAGLAAGGPTAPRTFLNQEIGRDSQDRIHTHGPRGPQARPRRHRGDGERRDPLGRDRGPAPDVRAAGRTGARAARRARPDEHPAEGRAPGAGEPRRDADGRPAALGVRPRRAAAAGARGDDARQGVRAG